MSIDENYLDAFDAGHIAAPAWSVSSTPRTTIYGKAAMFEAIDNFQRARCAVDTLLAANAGLSWQSAAKDSYVPPPEAATPLLRWRNWATCF